MPEPRQEVASASVDGRLYVLGGFDSGRRSTSSVFIYDGTWRNGPELPVALDHPAAAVLDGRLYLAGGYAAGPASRRVFRLEGDRWTELAAMRYPRGALALAAAAGLLVALGGSNGAQNLSPVEAYDPAANAWRDIGTLPVPRNHITGFSLEGQACAAGGRFPNSPRIDCLDPRSGAWKRLPDLPTPTSGAGAGELAGTVIVAGGEDAEESRLVTELHRLSAGGWTSEPMLVARHGVSLAQHQGRLWACGGADQPGYHAVTACTSIA
jgi:non-specific serine/threonine protein kinase